MTALKKIDSNVTGLTYAEEDGLGLLPATPIWNPLEPNSYDNFGGQITTIARSPINSGRQRQKGVVTDLDASGGFQSDLTQENLQDILQGFFFADLRRKSDVGDDRQPRRAGTFGEFEDYLITAIGASNDITVDSRVAVSAAVVAGGTGYAVGDVVQVTDANATVTARFIVTTVAAGVVTAVALTLAAYTGGREGRTDTDTGVGAATTHISGSGDDALTLTVTYGNGITWQVGDLVLLAGNNDIDNDGLKTVSSVTNNVVTVSETLVADAAPAAAASMTTVGFQGTAGDIDVDASASLPTLTSTTADFTTMNLIPGEWIFVGGDAVGFLFTTAANNGFARIKSVAQHVLTFDKTQSTMVTEASAAETIQLFFGRVLKNEADPTLQVRRSYNVERELGAPDDTYPAQIQGEYLVGAVCNEVTFNFATADKITVDVSFIATDNEQVTASVGLKAGTRPTLVPGDAFNTSSDFSRLKMSVLDSANADPSALFAYLTEFKVTVNNNLSPNKAISKLGAFDVTAGFFLVDGTATAYFADVSAVTAVRNNSDVTFDFAVVKGSSGAKSGIVVDVPLIALGDARLKVEQNQPITLPLSMPAAADRTFNHTMLMVFYDYLPDAADI